MPSGKYVLFIAAGSVVFCDGCAFSLKLRNDQKFNPIYIWISSLWFLYGTHMIVQPVTVVAR